MGEQHCGERLHTDVQAGPRTKQDCAVKRDWLDRSEAGRRSVAGEAQCCGQMNYCDSFGLPSIGRRVVRPVIAMMSSTVVSHSLVAFDLLA
jgi:hypothetical protein